MADSIADASNILRFWYGDEYFDDPQKLNTPEYFKSRISLWYAGGKDVDEKVQGLFTETIRAAAAGRVIGDVWSSRDGVLAKIILFDQLSRNAFRGSPEAFQYDEAARQLTQAFLKEFGTDGQLRPVIHFVLSPLIHSEDIKDLDLMLAELQKAGLPSEFTVNHREVLARFGRYPHRNRHYGRETTPEEAAWLASPDCPGWAKSQ